MKARNKIVSGYMQEYKFYKKNRRLYLKCLEQVFPVDNTLIKSIQVLDSIDYPAFGNAMFKGILLSELMGPTGMIVGSITAKKKHIYRLKITFSNNEIGLAEINYDYFRYLVEELFDSM